MYDSLILIIGFLSTALYIFGILSAFHSIMHNRSSQGAIAWSFALVTVPYIALPLYWTLSRNKFHGYVQAFRSRNKEIREITKNLKLSLPEFVVDLKERQSGYKVFERLSDTPFTGYNSAELLIDGDAVFSAIFDGIDKAKAYILVQFYIINDDKLGGKLKSKLIKAVKRGVRVYLLYDEIGCYSLPNSYIDELKAAGVEICPFKTTKGKSNRFQINFRNHRKIVVIDGHTAFVGGLNAGDEYMGLHPDLTPWRDTHVKVKGPAVQCVQISFVEDWYWATDSVLELNWSSESVKKDGIKVLVLSTGPADDFETCDLFFVSAINAAKRRIWIASPYFVLDSQMVCALQLAALRGVDVRVIVPKNRDRLFTWLASFSFFKEVLPAGVKIFFYQKGFMHQKVMLIDDDIASVGTANFDNRSFRLNFELSMVFADRAFAKDVEKMLERDLLNCSELKAEDMETLSFWFRLKVRVTRLFSEVL
jgi:cardiolipin synthase